MVCCRAGDFRFVRAWRTLPASPRHMHSPQICPLGCSHHWLLAVQFSAAALIHGRCRQRYHWNADRGSSDLAVFHTQYCCSQWLGRRFGVRRRFSLTLVSRILRGRRWYRPHREHLYQWMVRTGMSHAHVVACYMAWNVVIVIPALYWMNRSVDPHMQARGWTIAAIVYASALIVWLLGKARCLRKIESEDIACVCVM